MMITALVLVAAPLAQAGTPAGFVRRAQRAAAADLLQLLLREPGIGRVFLASPSRADLALEGVQYEATPAGPLHLGRYLADFIERHAVARLLLFGGGAAPLLQPETLAWIVTTLAQPGPQLVVNNQFSSDWAGIAPAAVVVDQADRLPQDNMLGWVLSTYGGLPVTVPPASAETRLDIDTPTDLLTLSLHHATAPALRAVLDDLALPTGRLERVLELLATPASRLFIAGRLGPVAWQALNRATRSWIRVLSEERGMISSGRAAAGGVRSLLADHIAWVGEGAFFATLDQWGDAALLDTRVWLAHHGLEPDDDDRFRSDLGLVEEIRDGRLRSFTAAVQTAPIPVLLGGHTLMAGSLFAFCDILWYKNRELPLTKE
jgi:hypothetical protein